MTKQKKPKTGDVVGWAVIHVPSKYFVSQHCTRKGARDRAWREEYSRGKGYRIAKIVLAK